MIKFFVSFLRKQESTAIVSLSLPENGFLLSQEWYRSAIGITHQKNITICNQKKSIRSTVWFQNQNGMTGIFAGQDEKIWLSSFSTFQVLLTFRFHGSEKNMIRICCRTKRISRPLPQLSGITACPIRFRQNRFSNHEWTLMDTNKNYFFQTNQNGYINNSCPFASIRGRKNLPASATNIRNHSLSDEIPTESVFQPRTDANGHEYELFFSNKSEWIHKQFVFIRV